MPRKREELAGRTIGNFKVLELDHFKETAGRMEDYWLCECQCADKTRKVIRGNNLRRTLNHPDDSVPGKTVSCGCFRRDTGVRREARMKLTASLRKRIAKKGGAATKKKWSDLK